MADPTFKPAFAEGCYSAMYSWNGATWVPATINSTFGGQDVVIKDSLGNYLTYDTATAIAGDVASGATDSGNPIKIGALAIAHGTNPTAVAAAQRTNLYANRAGVMFVQPGHPNVITRSHIIAAADGAQTDAALLTISTGSKIAIMQLSVKMDAANSGNTAVKIGFGTSTIAAASLAGTVGIVLEGQFAASGGHQTPYGLIAVGADNEDLRITCGAPTGGNARVTYSYYTIES